MGCKRSEVQILSPRQNKRLLKESLFFYVGRVCNPPMLLSGFKLVTKSIEFTTNLGITTVKIFPYIQIKYIFISQNYPLSLHAIANS